MKIELDSGKDGAMCLRLVAETADERRILVMLDGSQANTLALGEANATTYLVSKPVVLSSPPALPAEEV
jgi:hypothetical protein